MKYDGHVKLTTKALEKLKDNCPTSREICTAAMFNDTQRIWMDDKSKSNTTDNYSSALVNYVGHSITPDIFKQVTLPDAVSFVDLRERWTHEHPEEQHYYFMRAPKETNSQAYITELIS